MRITVGYGDPARGQARKLLRSPAVAWASSDHTGDHPIDVPATPMLAVANLRYQEDRIDKRRILLQLPLCLRKSLPSGSLFSILVFLYLSDLPGSFLFFISLLFFFFFPFICACVSTDNKRENLRVMSAHLCFDTSVGSTGHICLHLPCACAYKIVLVCLRSYYTFPAASLL